MLAGLSYPALECFGRWPIYNMDHLCACGGAKGFHEVVCRACWLAAPASQRKKCWAAITAASKRSAILDLKRFAIQRLRAHDDFPTAQAHLIEGRAS